MGLRYESASVGGVLREGDDAGREHAQVIESLRELPLLPGGIMSMGTARNADRYHD